MVTDAAKSLVKFLDNLVPYRVTDWTSGGSQEDAGHPNDRVAVHDLKDAHVVSSQIKHSFFGAASEFSHHLLLDIDRPTWLIESSTPGHYHLYVDMGAGIPEDRWQSLLWALVDAGVIERGYARASINRGFTSLRLPWIKKGQTP